ncbi:hypothetical protein HBI09_148190 [Parastagonospora nodorum]|nr:hypothetical protein HBI09_148190 [Parastagonospora nodorum]KAH4998398.1 hypothetical protein HBI77_185260 [Parastagonospora nodorum]
MRPHIRNSSPLLLLRGIYVLICDVCGSAIRSATASTLHRRYVILLAPKSIASPQFNISLAVWEPNYGDCPSDYY